MRSITHRLIRPSDDPSTNQLNHSNHQNKPIKFGYSFIPIQWGRGEHRSTRSPSHSSKCRLGENTPHFRACKFPPGVTWSSSSSHRIGIRWPCHRENISLIYCLFATQDNHHFQLVSSSRLFPQTPGSLTWIKMHCHWEPGKGGSSEALWFDVTMSHCVTCVLLSGQTPVSCAARK